MLVCEFLSLEGLVGAMASTIQAADSNPNESIRKNDRNSVLSLH